MHHSPLLPPLTSDYYGQVHILVNSTIEMIGASRIERADLVRVIASKVLVDRRRTSLFRRFRSPIDPRAICNNVRYRLCVYKRQHGTL